MYAMTAAHPSLPIPSYVRVTNLGNGRSAVVRVNDRGPFHPGRIIDLSYAAAYKLGYLDQGQASVEVALVLPEDVALVQPARPIPPMRKARAVAAARQPATPVPVEPSRPSAAEPQVVAVAPPPVVVSAAPTAVAPVAVAGKAPERAGAQVFLQLASFPSLPTAESFKVFVESELKWLTESVQVLSLGGKYRLQVGPFASAGEARTMAERIACFEVFRTGSITRSWRRSWIWRARWRATSKPAPRSSAWGLLAPRSSVARTFSPRFASRMI